MINTNECLCFNLITDSHLYSFEEPLPTQPLHTLENIRAVNDKTGVDCAFHLGDIMWSTQHLRDIKYWSPEHTEEFMLKVRDEYIEASKTCYFVSGNHDDIDAAEPNPVRWYRKMVEVNKDKIFNFVENKPYYSVDFKKQKVRAICIMSCYMDDTGCYYGFYSEQIKWLEKELLSLPDGYKVLIFTHIDPIGDGRKMVLDNQEDFMKVLEAFQNGESYKGEAFSVDFTNKTDAEISAMFAGHGHFDLTIAKEPFYIIERASNHLHEINEGDNTYKFVDENGAVIRVETVDYGTVIELPDYTPKANTAQYSYTFLGWDGYSDDMTITDNVTFTAMYEKNINQYTYRF